MEHVQDAEQRAQNGETRGLSLYFSKDDNMERLDISQTGLKKLKRSGLKNTVRRIKQKKITRNIVPLGFKQEAEFVSLCKLGCNISQHGYHYAAKVPCKTLTPSRRAIQLSGGTPLMTYAEVKVQMCIHEKGNLNKHKTRHCQLTDGILKFFSTSCVSKDYPADKFLFPKETIHLQRIRSVWIDSFESKIIRLSLWKEEQDLEIELPDEGSQQIVKQGAKLGNFISPNTPIKGLGARKNFSFNHDDFDGRYRFISFDKSQKWNSVKFERSLSASHLPQRNQKNSNGSTLKRWFFRQKNSRTNRQSSDRSDRSFVDIRIRDEGSVLEETHEDDSLEVLSAPSATTTEKVNIIFGSPQQMNEFAKYLLIDIENQARLFDAYADITKDEKGNHEGVSSIFRRNAVDFWTAARGLGNQQTRAAQKRLAHALRSEGNIAEANAWLYISNEKLPEENDMPTKKDTFFDLSRFLKQFQINLGDSDEAARQLYEKLNPFEIAVQLYMRYGRVPSSLQKCLILRSRQSPMEEIQLELDSTIEEIKRRDG